VYLKLEMCSTITMNFSVAPMVGNKQEVAKQVKWHGQLLCMGDRGSVVMWDTRPGRTNVEAARNKSAKTIEPAAEQNMEAWPANQPACDTFT
jgi:hypothetical protein